MSFRSSLLSSRQLPWLSLALTLAMTAMTTPTVKAEAIVFGAFASTNPTAGSAQPFSFTPVSGGTGEFSANATVLFSYSAAAIAADPSLSSTPFMAKVSLMGEIVPPGGLTAGQAVDTVSFSNLSITKVGDTTPQFTANFTGGISGPNDGSAATITSDVKAGNSLSYSSGVPGLDLSSPDSLQLNLSHIGEAGGNPFSFNTSTGTLNAFTADISGQFSANFGSVGGLSVPEPASVAMVGTGLAATVVVAVRRRRRQGEAVTA